MIDVGKLTDQLLNSMSQSAGQRLGDGIRPEGVGWLDGQPNVGVFIPYGVLAFQGGTPRDTTLRFEQSIRAWLTNWRLSYYGGSREQCDWVAARFRDTLDNAIGQQFGLYRVTMANWKALGGLERRDEIDPPMWTATDTFILNCDA